MHSMYELQNLKFKMLIKFLCQIFIFSFFDNSQRAKNFFDDFILWLLIKTNAFSMNACEWKIIWRTNFVALNWCNEFLKSWYLYMTFDWTKKVKNAKILIILARSISRFAFLSIMRAWYMQLFIKMHLKSFNQQTIFENFNSNFLIVFLNWKFSFEKFNKNSKCKLNIQQKSQNIHKNNWHNFFRTRSKTLLRTLQKQLWKCAKTKKKCKSFAAIEFLNRFSLYFVIHRRAADVLFIFE